MSTFRPLGCRLPRQNELLFLQFLGGVVLMLEKAQDGRITQGVGRRVEMVRDWKVLSFVMNREQALYKAVSKPPLGLLYISETMSGAADAVARIDRRAGEPLSDERDLFGALNG
eukprot:g21823.t1